MGLAGGGRVISCIPNQAVIVYESGVLVSESMFFGFRIRVFGFRIKVFSFRVRVFSFRIRVSSFRISLLSESGVLVSESGRDRTLVVVPQNQYLPYCAPKAVIARILCSRSSNKKSAVQTRSQID